MLKEERLLERKAAWKRKRGKEEKEERRIQEESEIVSGTDRGSNLLRGRVMAACAANPEYSRNVQELRRLASLEREVKTLRSIMRTSGMHAQAKALIVKSIQSPLISEFFGDDLLPWLQDVGFVRDDEVGRRGGGELMHLDVDLTNSSEEES